jgi:hypothetical protein
MVTIVYAIITEQAQARFWHAERRCEQHVNGIATLCEHDGRDPISDNPDCVYGRGRFVTLVTRELENVA